MGYIGNITRVSALLGVLSSDGLPHSACPGRTDWPPTPAPLPLSSRLQHRPSPTGFSSSSAHRAPRPVLVPRSSAVPTPHCSEGTHALPLPRPPLSDSPPPHPTLQLHAPEPAFHSPLCLFSCSIFLLHAALPLLLAGKALLILEGRARPGFSSWKASSLQAVLCFLLRSVLLSY